MENRKYLIFSTTELEKIDFNEVLETSAETVRKSVDGTKTFVKWNGTSIPTSLQTLVTGEGPLSYEQMKTILASPEWTSVEDEV